MEILRVAKTILPQAIYGVALSLLGLLGLHPDATIGQRLQRSSYDWSHSLRVAPARILSESPVFIIYLDIETYKTLQIPTTEPFDRAWYAKLTRALSRSGVKSLVFDIVFTDPQSPDSDRSFADAISEAGSVILAGELTPASRDTGRDTHVSIHNLERPWRPLLESAAGFGLATLLIDPDFTVRRYLDHVDEFDAPSLTWRATELTKMDNRDRTDHARWTYYYGPPFSIPHISLHEALNPTPELSALLKDKVVLVGARPMTSTFGHQADEFRTPYRSWSEPNGVFMPGVEVHATQLLNLLESGGLRRGSPISECVILILAGMLLAIAATRQSASRFLLGAAITAAAITTICVALFHQVRFWFPWTLITFAQIPAAILINFSFRSTEWLVHRRRSEAKIREQAALLDKAKDAIFVQSMEGVITFWNLGAEKLYGWSQSEISIPGNLESISREPNEVLESARASAIATGEWVGEIRQRSRAGDNLIVQSRWTRITNDSGAPSALLIINSDITEQKKIEERFLRAQKMETVGALASGMAHDLNNALAPIVMGIQLLKKRPLDEKAQRLLNVMETNALRGGSMIRQALAFSRGGAEEREVVHPEDFLREIDHLVKETFPSSIRVDCIAPENLWDIFVDRNQISQALLNLCVNARDAMPNGGEILIAADNFRSAEGSQSIADDPLPPGDYVYIMVSDTGEGIPKERLDHIFEPFFTTKPKGQGTGLGLASARGIIEAHSGRIQVKSELGVGSIFEIYIPAIAERPPSTDPTK